MPAPQARALRAPDALYAPPYEDAVTEGFVWNLVKYLAPAFDLAVQAIESGTLVTIEAPSARGRSSARSITFAFAKRTVAPDSSESRGNTTEFAAYEMEGESQKKLSRSFINEISGRVPPGALYVLRVEDIVHRLPDVLAVVAQWDASLFSERGRLNLHRLASAEARAARVTPSCSRVIVSYPDARSATSLVLDSGVAIPATLAVHRKMLARPSTSPVASTTPPVCTAPPARTAGQRGCGLAACG